MAEQRQTSPFWARLLSLITHPVFVPTYVYAFWLYTHSPVLFGVPEKNQHWWLIIIAYITITFPVLVVVLLWKLKFIQSVYLRESRERYAPLIASMLFYFWTFWLFHKQMLAPFWLQTFLLGVFLGSVGVFMVNLFTKISLHTSAWGAVLILAIIQALHQESGAVMLLVATALIAGGVGSLRLWMHEHQPKQIYLGYLIGFITQVMAYLICTHYLH